MSDKRERESLLRSAARLVIAISAAVSLLLLVTVCVLWVRSYFLSDRITWKRSDGMRSIQTASGHIVLDLRLSDYAGVIQLMPDWCGLEYDPTGVGRPFNSLPMLARQPDDENISREWGGFAWYEKRNARKKFRWVIGSVPMWWVAIATAQLPLAWRIFRRWVRAHDADSTNGDRSLEGEEAFTSSIATSQRLES